jgi:excisionase family DNA binding protein
MNTNVPFDQRVTCTVAEACEFTGLGKTLIFSKIADNTIHSVMIGRRRLIKVPSLMAMVWAQPSEQQHAA